MTNEELEIKIIKNVEDTVNMIAEKKYAALADVTNIDESWIENGMSQKEAFAAFGEWLDGQLKMWEEDEGIEFKVDRFKKSCMDDVEIEEDKSFITYNPTNSGEELDFWFEFEFEVKDEKLISKFNVNI